jgi:hypothetical protein
MPRRIEGSRFPRNALECVQYVAYASLVGAGEDADYVEAQGVEVWVAVGEILGGERADGTLFAWGYGFERIPESGSAAQFHLHEDEGVVFADDQVDLPVAGPVVAFDEGVSPAGKVA